VLWEPDRASTYVLDSSLKLISIAFERDHLSNILKTTINVNTTISSSDGSIM
jgi:hypothetical protein